MVLYFFDTITLMIKTFFKRYLGIVFIVATLMGSFHHHNDLKQHNNCPICIINANLFSGDETPKVTYLQDIEFISEAITKALKTLHDIKLVKSLKARSPPCV